MSEHTKGPWEVFIDDSGGQWTGWPLSITAPSVHQDCMVVRTGGQWPYKWDYHISQAEAVSNAHLIAAAPDLLAALKLALPQLQDNALFLRNIQAHAGKVVDAFSAVKAVEAAIDKAGGDK